LEQVLLGVPGQGSEALARKLADLALSLAAAPEVPTLDCPLHPHIDRECFAFRIREQQDTIGHFLADSRQHEEDSAGWQVLFAHNGLEIDISGDNAPGDVTHVRSAIA
jgi:hypothetical protein